MAFEGVRIPRLDPLPANTAVGRSWLTVVYDLVTDKTYRASLAELPFLTAADSYRTISYTDFDTERKKSKLRLGRVSVIINRKGTRATSQVFVIEGGPQFVVLAAEIDVTAGTAVPVIYNPVDDTITQIQGSGGGVAPAFFPGLPGGPIRVIGTSPQTIEVPEKMQIIVVWWRQKRQAGDYIVKPVYPENFAYQGTQLSINANVVLATDDYIDVTYAQQ